MYSDNNILLGKSEEREIFLESSMANRHGIISGATGTGKTITLKVLAESFSDAGVPVFFSDVKGDLAGTAFPGEAGGSALERVEKMGLNEKGFSFKGYPVNLWDVYGEGGMPLRTTVSEMGPLLLAKDLGLNDVQSDILSVIFRIADDEGQLLLDTKDLKSMLTYAADNLDRYSSEYGNIPKNSVNAIIRSIAALEAEGGNIFFGEPAISISDLIAVDSNGKGKINILDARQLILHPAMYSTFLLYLLSEFFEVLPEVGDMEKPKMVFFFDEAHLLFDGISSALLQKVEQVVKLIRSKGVGIYFVTQDPSDVPDGIMNQLGNKVQHALRAYTPKEIKAVKQAAETYRENPAFDTLETIQSLGTGAAVVSLLDTKGIPQMAEKIKVLPPSSRMGAITDSEREKLINENLLYTKYKDMIDRESAYETLKKKVEQDAEEATEAAAEAAAQKEEAKRTAAEQKAEIAAAVKAERERVKEEERKKREEEKERERKKKEAERTRKAVTREVGKVASQLGRGLLGNLFKR